MSLALTVERDGKVDSKLGGIKSTKAPPGTQFDEVPESAKVPPTRLPSFPLPLSSRKVVIVGLLPFGCPLSNR